MIIAEKTIVRIEICELQVRGLTILFQINGLQFQIRYLEPTNRPLLLLMVRSHFLESVL